MNEPTPGTSQIVSTNTQQKKKQLTMNEKKIALRVFNHIEKTSKDYPYKSEVSKITAELFGVSNRTIRRIISNTTEQKAVQVERPVKRGIINNLDDFMLSAIRRKIHQKYCKRSRRGIYLDRPDLQIWRKNYLIKISNYRREERKIYYMDETWLNEGHTCNYVWVDTSIESSRDAFLKGLTTGLKCPPKGKRLIIVHIGSEEGFIKDGEWVFVAKKSDGDYHGEMNSHNFEKWFENIVQKVEPGSVIVMDNAPYHSRLIERVPNMNWRKADIQSWLQEKEIQFDINEIKAELLTKINKNTYNKKYIDELAASKGVIVLRLPPYHCELNPIELIWAQVKGYVGRNNKTHKIEDLKILLFESMARITAESWKTCIQHILKVEEKMKKLDGILDKASDGVEEFIIEVGGSTTSTEYSDSDNNKEN